MSINQKIPALLKRAGLDLLIPLFLIGLIGILLLFELKTFSAEADFEVFSNQSLEIPQLPVVQNNSFSSISDPSFPNENLIVLEQIPVIITGYSSSPGETDNTPHLTAAGTWAREGIVANNLLPFGTKIKIPEIYGDKIFIVEDRMNSRKGDYHFDVWFSSSEKALNFGAKTTYIEILEG